MHYGRFNLQHQVIFILIKKCLLEIFFKIINPICIKKSINFIIYFKFLRQYLKTNLCRV